MSGASESARAQVLASHEAEFAQNGLALGEELFSVVDLLDENPGLRRALSDPSRESTDKALLVRQLLGDKLSGAATGVVADLVGKRFTDPADLTDALESLAAAAVLAHAEGEGQGSKGLDKVEEALFGFQEVLAQSHDVQAAFASRQAKDESKRDLALKLAPHAPKEAQALIERAVVHPRGQRIERLLRSFQSLVADRQRRYIAEASVAKPLSEHQLTRLREALGKLYKRELNLNVRVDPALVGGIRVQVGDEVLDASVLNRLNELNRQLAG